MPQIENGKTVEELYWDCVRKMSPTERVRRATGLNTSICAMIKKQLHKEQPEYDEKTLKFALAKRIYWDEPNIFAILKEAEKDIAYKNKIVSTSANDDLLMMNLDRTTEKVMTILEETQHSFAITGGLAAITYGDPRTTKDIDIIMEINASETDFADILFEQFNKDFFFCLEGCREAIERQTIFQAMDKETMFKVDFHLSDLVPGSCARRKNVQILTGHVVPMVTPEDSILSQLVWIKRDKNYSRKDVVAMLRVQTNLDNEYLETTAEKLGVTEILKKLRIIAESYDPNIIL